MIPTDFFKEIVTPNVDALGNDVGDLRHAVNAILSLDALAGIIHANLYARGAETADDVAFRDRRLNDISNTASFGTPPSPSSTASYGARSHGWCSALSKQLIRRSIDEHPHRSAFDTEAVIWIEANDPATLPARRSGYPSRPRYLLRDGLIEDGDGQYLGYRRPYPAAAQSSYHHIGQTRPYFNGTCAETEGRSTSISTL